MFKWPSRSTKLPDTTNESFHDDNALAGSRSRPSPGAAAVVASAVEEGRRRGHRDDAPMTPVVYVVLWTSMAVGGLRGYALNSSLAARVGPAYTYFFSHRHQSEVLRTDSPYCTNGVDGLPGVSWYEFAIATVPPVLAPILAAVFVNYRGRKAGIMLGCVLMIIGQVLLASSQLLVQLYIGQAFVLTASDVLFLCVALQCIEIAPRTSRGSFLVVHIVGYAVGSCVVAVIGYLVSSPSNLGWRLLYAMGTLPAMAVLMVTPWLYETPHSSIERGCYAEGWEALREIRGPFYDDTYAEFMSIVRAAAAAPKGFLMYAELFRKRNYWPGICVGIAMATVAALLDPLSKTYVAYQTLARSGVSYNNAVLMSSLSLHGAYAVGALICVVLVDRIGRLPLLRASSTMAVLAVGALVASSLVYVTKHGVYGHKVTDTPHLWPRLQLVTLAILAGGNGIAWSSAMWVIICESQSLAVRPAAVALCIAAFNLAASVLESKLLCVLQPLYHVVVLVVSFVAVVIAFGFVPETARVSLEDISDLYARHWWWSRVVNPRPRRRRRGTADKTRPNEGQNHTPGCPRAQGGSPAISGGVGSTEPDRAANRGKDVAALADDFSSSGPQSTPSQTSPFGRTNIQTVLSQSMEEAVGDDPKTAEAVAAAAKIALAGAASSAAASLHSSQALQLGRRSSRRPLRLAGKRKSSHAIEGTTADVVEQLADELEVDD